MLALLYFTFVLIGVFVAWTLLCGVFAFLAVGAMNIFQRKG